MNIEKTRLSVKRQIFNVEVMQKYLVILDKDELDKAADEKVLPQFKLDPNATDQEIDHVDTEYETAAQSAKARLDKIRLWCEVDETEPYIKEDQKSLLKQHEEKLNRYRQRKEWEKVIEEDDQDLDGERILSEISNYKSEYFFNTNFYQ